MNKRYLSLLTATVVAASAITLYAQDSMKKSSEAKTQSHDKMKKAPPAPAKPADGMKKNAFTPGEMTWGDGPPFIPAGAKMAVLDGNPMGDEIYTLRLKLPAGYKVGAHWHPKREEVTVISGNLQIGMGEKFDAAKLKGYPSGSFFYMDPQMHHFAEAKGATEIQIHGRGPVQFNYIDPNDDPSKKK